MDIEYFQIASIINMRKKILKIIIYDISYYSGIYKSTGQSCPICVYAYKHIALDIHKYIEDGVIYYIRWYSFLRRIPLFDNIWGPYKMVSKANQFFFWGKYPIWVYMVILECPFRWWARQSHYLGPITSWASWTAAILL